MGTSISASDALSGNIVISYVHEAPSDYCSRLDPLPTSVTLNVTANWMGSLSNSTLALDPWGVSIDTYVKSNAVISAPGLPAFTPTPEQIGSATSKDINQTKNFAFAVGAGNTPYSGSVDIQTLFGFGSGTLGDFATGTASLSITGNLINSTQNIRYLVPVPEPSATLLMGLGIIGIGYAKRRKRQPVA
ncbi:PEP-CTERM sorting domain-containing protein [Chlorobaculum limnaeum]|uniref:PEP-CTERM sorting domain-containing protein n=1 Tax=Chlorobaculum limnaeum TaxID=274537 RepID=UPI001472477D|nr:PEP-CTERM sorting domain-containing protein [Chlorobaculum limnaeum]